MPLDKNEMSQENLIRFGECVLTLHETLRTLVKESDLFEELNALTHQMMDVTLKRSTARKSRSLTYSNNHRKTPISEKRNSTRYKKVYHTSKSPNLENGVSDFKTVKPCFVKLDKICEAELNRLLATKCSNQVQSSSTGLEMHSVQPIENKPIIPEDLIPIKNTNTSIRATNININNKFLATEDHLDLLMAVEMRSSYPQMGNRVSGGDECGQTNSMENHNLNPVVLLERLSPQFIARAVDGKLEKRSHEFTKKRKLNVSTLKRIAGPVEIRRSKRSSIVKLKCSCCSLTSSSGLRRSERLSHVSLLTESQNSFFYNRRNSCPSRRQHKIKDDKENLLRSEKRSYKKTNYSDDEEEFYGFECQTKNRRRIKKMKEALKTLNVQPPGKEKRRILKVKESLRTYCPCPSGKEKCVFKTLQSHRILKVKESLKTLYLKPSGKKNETTNNLNRDFKNLMKHKVPFKALNRIEDQCTANGDTKFKNSIVGDYQLSMRDNHLNARNQMAMVHRNNSKCDDVADDEISLKRLEILQLFKKKEKFLVNKVVREQGKIIVSKSGEPLKEDQFLNEPFSYYSKEYRIKGVGKRKPLWTEEIIRNVIIESQEKIPIDIIAGYFHDHNPPDPTSFFQEMFF